MKKYVLFILMIFCCQVSFGQDLTKEETVNYINKKLKEVLGKVVVLKPEAHGFFKPGSGGEIETQANAYIKGIDGFSLRGNKISLRYTISNYKEEGELQNYRSVNGNWYTVNVYPCDYLLIEKTYTFDPIHIDFIDEEIQSSGDKDIGIIKVGIKYENAEFKEWVITTRYGTMEYKTSNKRCYDLSSGYGLEAKKTGVVYIPFMKRDPNELNKLKRAIEHLKDLSQAEDDPFGD